MDVSVRFSPELWIFLAPRNRRPEVAVPYDGTSSLGHLIESAGVPLTEAGTFLAGGRPVERSYRPGPDEVVEVPPAPRPQAVPCCRFVLDVHLGTLARRLRLVGLDTAYRNDMDDDALIEQANAEDRVLLTQDRGILRRRSLRHGAYVRGARPDDQFLDVLDRFRPRWPRGPDARPATGGSPRSARPRWRTRWSRGPGAAMTSSPAASTAAGSTGGAPTAATSRPSSAAPSTPYVPVSGHELRLP